MDCNTIDINIYKTPGTTITIGCDLKLSKLDTIARGLVIQQSNQTIDCRGGKLADLTIKSKYIGGIFTPTTNVIIKNCTLSSIRIVGHSVNGQDSLNVADSHINVNHTLYTQSVAPDHILLTNLLIKPANKIPVYISPGVHDVTISDSVISGTSPGVAMYLDAESGSINILRNKINTLTTKRELIAIDGSANNVIANNTFSNLGNGGIFLYRNCGEGGAIRFQTPSGNLIENNTFIYKSCTAITCKPGIWISARGQQYVGWLNIPGISFGYCNADRGYWPNMGTSSSDNNDNASNNTIRNNNIPSNFIMNTEFNHSNNITQ